MHFDLVRRGNDLAVGEQLVKSLDGKVRYTDRFDFSCKERLRGKTVVGFKTTYLYQLTSPSPSMCR